MPYKQCFPFFVEDDEDFILILNRAIQKAGVPKDNIRILKNGDQAITALEKVDPASRSGDTRTPSLVLLDVNLPGKNGLTILEWLKQREIFKDVPVFMLTSSEKPEHIARAFELKVQSYFVKPQRIDELQTI